MARDSVVNLSMTSETLSNRLSTAADCCNFASLPRSFEQTPQISGKQVGNDKHVTSSARGANGQRVQRHIAKVAKLGYQTSRIPPVTEPLLTQRSSRAPHAANGLSSPVLHVSPPMTSFRPQCRRPLKYAHATSAIKIHSYAHWMTTLSAPSADAYNTSAPRIFKQSRRSQPKAGVRSALTKTNFGNSCPTKILCDQMPPTTTVESCAPAQSPPWNSDLCWITVAKKKKRFPLPTSRNIPAAFHEVRQGFSTGFHPSYPANLSEQMIDDAYAGLLPSVAASSNGKTLCTPPKTLVSNSSCRKTTRQRSITNLTRATAYLSKLVFCTKRDIVRIALWISFRCFDLSLFVPATYAKTA